jgi:hypothetical protein
MNKNQLKSLIKECIKESELETDEIIKMWHGGRGLERDFNEYHPNKSKQMEYGPGLYLTNDYFLAYKYSKGGGKTYLVSFQKGTDLNTVNVSIDKVISFIKSTRMPRKSSLLNDLKKYSGEIPLIYLVNLSVNNSCLSPSNSIDFRKFFVDCGADYEMFSGYGGNNDVKISVIYNPSIIKKVEIVPANKVNKDMWML